MLSIKARKGQSLEEIAEKIYGNKEMWKLVSKIKNNDACIKDKKVIKNCTLIIPYAPLPPGNNSSDPSQRPDAQDKDDSLGNIMDWAGVLLGNVL